MCYCAAYASRCRIPCSTSAEEAGHLCEQDWKPPLEATAHRQSSATDLACQVTCASHASWEVSTLGSWPLQSAPSNDLLRAASERMPRAPAGPSLVVRSGGGARPPPGEVRRFHLSQANGTKIAAPGSLVSELASGRLPIYDHLKPWFGRVRGLTSPFN